MTAAAARAGPGQPVWSALADPHRRRVVELLGQGPQRAGELAVATGLTPPAMSRHLRSLREAGLVAEAAGALDARVRVYSLRREGMAELKAWLEQTERLWTDQLLAFKAHVEGSETAARPADGDRPA